MTSGTLILGLLNGLIIGLLALGFVLVYKANGFLNLAHAQMGAVSALFLAKAVDDWHWNWWLSLAACVAVGVATGLVVERFLVSVVRRRSRATVRLLMLTIGVGDLLLALTFIPGLIPRSQAGFPQPFTSHLQVGGVVLTGMSVLTMVLVPVLLVAFTVFLEWTSTGKQIRAAANNPEAARLCGISTTRVSLICWGMAGGLSALSAVLNGPTTATFNAEAFGPYLLMLTMGAAAVGAFVSIPAAVGGGVGLGLLYQIVAAETKNAGTAEIAVFGAILVVILVRGRAIGRVFATAGAAVPELPGLRFPAGLRDSVPLRWTPRGLLIGAVALAVVFPHLPYFARPGNQFLLALVLIYALLGVSLTMLVGWAGQVSMGNFAIVGVAAFLTARWAGQHGWNVVDMLVVTGVIGAVVSMVIGLPALRVRGLTLAVATLGFAVIAPDWLFQEHWLAGSTPFTTVVAPTSVLPGIGHINAPVDLYYLVLAVLILVVAAAGSLRRSAAGRMIIAVRDNERAASSFGIRPPSVKLRVLAVSGAVAASAGVFWALAWQSLTPVQFPADVSIAILALPVIGGIGSLGGTVAAAVVLYMGTFFIGPHVSGLLGSFGQNEGFLLFFSGLGVVGSMLQFPNGIAGGVQAGYQSYLNRRAVKLEATGADRPDDVLTSVLTNANLARTPVASASTSSTSAPHLTSPRRLPVAGAPPLTVTDVAIRFGGIAALDGASMVVPAGQIVGLIGPNGAGKTTLMNIISGVLRPDRGSVRLYGQEVAGRPAERRAAYGLARSFQDASLFAGLTVVETVQVAMADGHQPRFLPALIGQPWARSTRLQDRRQARAMVEEFGLGPWADALTVELSTGMRRICDLMAQVATRPRLLLLDEPTAGVAQREAEAFGPLLRRIRDALDCSVLIIEHDMPLLMGLCDRVYAMEAGRVIADGTPQEIRNTPAVIASYLGTDSTAISRSGHQPTIDLDAASRILTSQGEAQ